MKDITGPLLDFLQFANLANKSVEDSINMGLNYICSTSTPRDICKDPVSGLCLSVQHHHPRNPPLKIHPAHSASLHLSVENKQEHGGEARLEV